MVDNRAADERFMSMALEEARVAASIGEVPIGAVVVHEGRVIARAHNRREADEDPSAHAEFAAMMEASRALGRWRLTGCTVYVTLEPCLMCAGLMVNARIDRCVFGASDPKGGAVGTLYDVSCDERLNHAFDVTPGVLEDECAAVLRAFFQELRAGRGLGPRADGAASVAGVLAADSADAGYVAVEAGLEAPRAGAELEASPVDAGDLQRRGSRSMAASHANGGSVPGPVRALRRRRAPYAGCMLLAIDSFKGSATSSQVEEWLAQGARAACPDLACVPVPVADGGEGTLEAFHSALGGEVRRVMVPAPIEGSHAASFLLAPDGEGRLCAVIEMAQAAGIDASPCTHEAALAASTRGVGELMCAAIEADAKTLYVGLGGSATTDGGAGMLQVLGARVLDRAGDEVRPGLAGLRDVVSIDVAPARERLAGVALKVLTDVKSPLVGACGSVRMFGPQKGLGADASADERAALLAEYDRWMAAYGAKLTDARDALDGTELQVAAAGARPKSLAGVPGAGAAGGLGAAFLALGAELTPGADALLDLVQFDELVRGACVVVTGEGSVDAQTAEGKVPVGVAHRAKCVRPDVPVYAVCGSRAENLERVYAAGVDVVLPIEMGPQTLEQALSTDQTRANLIATGETLGRIMGLGR